MSDIFTESDETFAMMLLENNLDEYKPLIELKMKLTRKEAMPKYTKDPNTNDFFKEWLRKGIKRYNGIIKGLRLDINTQVSKEMKIELKLKYARIWRKIGVRNGLGDDIDSDDNSDGEDLEAYDGFAGDLTVIHVEQRVAFSMNKYTLLLILC